jgi:hypothetical protein
MRGGTDSAKEVGGTGRAKDGQRRVVGFIGGRGLERKISQEDKELALAIRRCTVAWGRWKTEDTDYRGPEDVLPTQERVQDW